MSASPSLDFHFCTTDLYRPSTFSRHAWCLCLFLPLSNFAMLATGPHGWRAALLWTFPVWFSIAADRFSPAMAEGSKFQLPELAYKPLLCLLTLLQIGNIFLMLQLVSQLAWNTASAFAISAANILAIRILTGTTSCCSGIALAHELIHRPSPRLRWLGRIVLWTVLYDHFAFAHVQSHHRHAGTEDDFSTARQGESFGKFWWRSTTGQLTAAWRQESIRVRSRVLPLWLLNHRVIQGMAAQAAILAAIWLVCGWVAMAMFVYQAVVAVRLLEAVNYFQHWGLNRQLGDPTHPIAWSTRSWFSIHSLLGLPLHGDHHCHARKPFHHLRIRSDAPELPYGYFVCAILIRVSNHRFQHLAKRELHSKCRLFQFGTVSAAN